MSAQSEQRWKRRGERENNEQAALAGMIAGLGLPRSPRVAAATTRNHTRAYVRQWMVANIHEVDNYTFLAEAAADKLDLPQEWLDDETHWIWDEALRAIERIEGGEA